MRMKRIAGATAAATAVALIAVGCSSTDDGAPAADSSAAKPSVDASKVSTLVLGKADLPAGYQILEVPKEQREKIADSISPSTKNAKITPAKCKQLTAFPSGTKPSEVGYVMAMKATSVLAETVAVVDGSVADVRKNASGECANLKIEITDGPAAGAKATASAKVLDAPKSKADDAVLIQQKTTISLNGTKTKTTMLIGVAEVNGYFVTVQASDGTPGGTPDLAAFKTFFGKAVDRVATQS